MALIENLVVALGLQSAQFNAGMKKAGQDLSGFGKATDAMSNGMMGFTKNLLGAVIAFTGIRNVVENLSGSMDRLFGQAMSASKLGMSVESFTGLSYAVGTLGIETEKFDTGMQKLLVSISNAAEGSEKEIGIFNRLGIATNKIKNAGPIDALKMLATGFEKIKNSAEATDLSRGLFGRGGAAMLNLMRLGADGIDNLLKRAGFLGVLISEKDMSKVVLLRQTWFDLGEAMKGVWNSILIAMGPGLSVIFDELTNKIVDARKEMELFGGSSETGISAATDALFRFYIIAGSIADVFKVIMYSTASISSWIYGAVNALGGNMALAKFYAGVAEKYSKLLDKTTEDLMKNLSGDKWQELLDKLNSVKARPVGGKEGEEYKGGGSEKLSPAALMRGTKEAAEAIFKMGGNDTNYAQQTVIKLADLNKAADAIDARLMAISGALGLDAGIV